MALHIPLELVPYVNDTKMYVKPSGNKDYPYDEFTGLTLSYIESHFLANIKDRDDLFSEVWTHKPSNMKHNVLYNLFDEKFYPR